MNKNCGIYKILNIINNKIYIGSAVRLSNRKATHFYKLKNNKHTNNYLQNAFNKYGGSKFKFEIIEYVDDKNCLIAREQYYMDLYKSYNKENGYNIRTIAESNLGVTGKKLSKEHRNAISKANLGKKLSDNTKKKISIAKKNPSKETRIKLSNANIGKKLSEETKRKIGEKSKGNTYASALKGRKLTEAHKLKIGESNKNFKSPFKGIPRSEEVKNKISKSNIGKKRDRDVVDKIINKINKAVKNITTGEVFASLKIASEHYSINHSNISQVCTGKRKSAGGFKWMFYVGGAY